MQRISIIRVDRGSQVGVPHVLDLVHKLGGNYESWYCNTTEDVDEAFASHGVWRDGESWSVQFESYSAAVAVKNQLKQLGFYCPPERTTRGGRILYGFRVTKQNCNKI